MASKALNGKKTVALYFSAHWCPPCRGFTPQLAGWYKQAWQHDMLVGVGGLEGIICDFLGSVYGVFTYIYHKD